MIESIAHDYDGCVKVFIKDTLTGREEKFLVDFVANEDLSVNLIKTINEVLRVNNKYSKLLIDIRK